MTYTIKHGNIAALIHVITPQGEDLDYIYTAGDKQPEASVLNRTPFAVLPLPVRAAVNKQFGTIFNMHLDQRGAYLKNLTPFTVEA